MLPPVARNSADAPSFWMLGILWTVLTDGSSTNGQWSCMEQLMPDGGGPPPHIHPFNDEWFYVLEGAMRMTVSGNEINAVPGSSVFIPRGNVHSFKVEGGPCRVLNVFTPAGMEQVIKSLGKPAAARTLPPDGMKEDARALSLFANNYWGMEADIAFAAAKFGPDGGSPTRSA